MCCLRTCWINVVISLQGLAKSVSLEHLSLAHCPIADQGLEGELKSSDRLWLLLNVFCFGIRIMPFITCEKLNWDY